jgi:hypothetical protein
MAVQLNTTWKVSPNAARWQRDLKNRVMTLRVGRLEGVVLAN